MSILILSALFCFFLASILFFAYRALPETFFSSKTFSLPLTAQDLRLPFSFVFHPNRWHQWLSLPFSYHQRTSTTYGLHLDGKPYLLTMDDNLFTITIAPIAPAPHGLWRILLTTNYQGATITTVYGYPKPSLWSLLFPKETSFDPLYLTFLKDLAHIFETLDKT